jgi:hypothetical protein
MTENPQQPRQSLKRWFGRFNRVGYFLGAVLFHAIVFLLLCTLVIFPAAPRPAAASFQSVQLQPQAPPPPPPPPQKQSLNALQHMAVTPPVPIPAINHLSAPSPFNFSPAIAAPNLPISLITSGGNGAPGTGTGGAGGPPGNPFGSKKGDQETLVGTLFDFTRNQAGESVTMAPFQTIVRDFVGQHWQPGSHPCYISPTKIYTNHIFVPVTPDEEAGAAFGSPQSSNAFWLVHYQAEIASNISGKFRFVGFGDNVLVVAIDGDVVLDASDLQYLHKKFSNLIGQMDITGPGKDAPTPLYSGLWFDLETAENHRIDIVIGDEGGVTTSGLFIQMQDITADNLAFAPNGAPKIPLFVLGSMHQEDQKNLSTDLPPECFKTNLILNASPVPAN